MHDAQCLKCGYTLYPWDKECPKCKRLAVAQGLEERELGEPESTSVPSSPPAQPALGGAGADGPRTGLSETDGLPSGSGTSGPHTGYSPPLGRAKDLSGPRTALWVGLLFLLVVGPCLLCEQQPRKEEATRLALQAEEERAREAREVAERERRRAEERARDAEWDALRELNRQQVEREVWPRGKGAAATQWNEWARDAQRQWAGVGVRKIEITVSGPAILVEPGSAASRNPRILQPLAESALRAGSLNVRVHSYQLGQSAREFVEHGTVPAEGVDVEFVPLGTFRIRGVADRRVIFEAGKF